MDAEDIAKAAAKAAVKWVKDKIREDRENRYSLLADWKLPVVRTKGVCPAFDYAGKYIDVMKVDEDRVLITVRKYTSSKEDAVCDGCSLSPDLPGCLEGAIFHDPWYGELEDMSRKTGIAQNQLRALGDLVFGNIVRAVRGDGLIARTYYWAVRAFGGIFHRLSVLAVLLAVLVAGCAGCAIPDVFEEGADVEAPHFEEVQE